MAGKTTVTEPKALQNSVKEGPVDTMFLAMAKMYEEMGQAESALGVYNNILKRNPNCVTALVGRGTIHLLNLHDEKAFKDLHKAAAMGSKDRVVLRTRGLAHLLTGNFDAAQKDFQKSFDCNEWDSLTVFFVYALKLKVNGPEEAMMFLADAVNNKIKNKEWPYPNLQFMKGDIQMTTLMDLGFSKSRQLEVRTYAGFWKAFSNNPPEGRADLQFVQSTNSGPPLVRLLAVRGVKIIDDGFMQKAAQSVERAERISDVDWMN